jgi:6-pyruvoyltetrahydropterin/6-carboxytetrahydropterin synthase
MSGTSGRFALHVEKETFKFSAAHFISYPGFREALHGHNYSVAVTVEGALGPTGYVLDFGVVKRIAKGICDELDERVIVPTRSTTVTVTERGEELALECADGSRFVLPRADVVLLPVVHSSAEELSRYLCERLTRELGSHASAAGLTAVEVSVAEAPGQAASYRIGL